MDLAEGAQMLPLRQCCGVMRNQENLNTSFLNLGDQPENC